MPSRQRVQALIDLVEASRFVEALEAFYREDATMQENDEPPRGGREVLIAGETALLAACTSIVTQPGSRAVIDGDRVVIQWTFTFAFPDGRTFDLEELAAQTWVGDQIATERFFYDPSQRNRPSRHAATPLG